LGNDVRSLWEKAKAELGREDAHGDEPTRRGFLKLLGASMALAGVSGCSKHPVERILPFTFRPPEVTPGLSKYYATSMTLDGYATGVLVEVRDGRPIKIEGNPEHPASLGAAGVFEQASILGLYDPTRAAAILQKGQETSGDALAAALARSREDAGAGLRILMEPTASPLLGHLLDGVLAKYPEARVVLHSPISTDGAAKGAGMALGRPLEPHYDLRAASVVVALDADFLAAMPMHLRSSRHFAERRRPGWPSPAMNRLYAVEALPSPTGSLADHRYRRRTSEIGLFAAALAAEMLLGEGANPGSVPADVLSALRPFLGREPSAIVGPIARDLRRAGASGLVIVGDRQGAHVHAIGALLHAALGAFGATVAMTEPILYDAGAASQDLASLAADMREGRVDTLVILEGNPVQTAPGDFDFAAMLRRVPHTFYLGAHVDETALACEWVVPAAHYLESWGDARAHDGTASIVQPVIRPMHGGRTAAELLALLLGAKPPDAYALVRERWKKEFGENDFEARWDAALRLGLVQGTEASRATVSLSAPGVVRALAEIERSPALAPERYEIGFYLDPKVHDGRFAENPWLQELPEPITKITWGNAALMSPKTAALLGVESGDLVDLWIDPLEPLGPAITRPSGSSEGVVLPAFVLSGHAERSISLRLGYGRRVGAVAEGVGTNVNPLRRLGAPFVMTAVPRRAGGSLRIARSQRHEDMHDRPIVLGASLAEYIEKPNFTRAQKGPVLSILPQVEYRGVQWAMTIDTSICTGCSACVVACQAENNIPVVGKEGVLVSREMHWIRIDTYRSDDPEAPAFANQPMLCQHCERAPCEYVCPVNATVHSPDGLNEMIYNRCIGTRFCSNNCPYKVRRFNWFDWIEENPDYNGGERKLQKNPDVTVRERGVMEKCTFCVQRIRRAEIDARIARRDILPGEVQTACAGACPTRAIQFGALSHENTDMVRWRAEPRSYSLLHELDTQPRVQYLALIKNPNPEVS